MTEQISGGRCDGPTGTFTADLPLTYNENPGTPPITQAKMAVFVIEYATSTGAEATVSIAGSPIGQVDFARKTSAKRGPNSL